ncbi:MAG: aminotransferase class I/II-fold pyridoxal phosphate-dependent enzyme [Candidatus Marinimicrobia bacterium]|nr:aminotransferase class I/II-fold pyridoxal phosphate-dependent enzyme [Candidatus Neomarinimicrobiota bacterium]
MDLFDKCSTDGGYFGKYRLAQDNYFSQPILEPHPGRLMKFNDSDQIMWSINNYLGLAENKEVQTTALAAVSEFSTSAPMGSRMMSGNTTDHIELERQLADYSQKDAAILFNYGYLGVLGTISSLAQQDDIIIIDKLSHASIVDGTFLSKVPFRVFRHNDMSSLEKLLKRVNRDRKGGLLIVIEGTFGMTGDLANLPEICRLKDQYDARLFVDDAHGFGVLGAGGRGIGEHFDVQDQIDIYFGTFAKAFASIGGFSSAPEKVVDWIRYNARTQVFAKSLPMVYVRVLLKTLELVINGSELRERMWTNANLLKEGLRNMGFTVGWGESPICPVYVTTAEDQMESVGRRMLIYLRDNGIFVTGVTWPVIPLGLIMFRMIPTASHLPEDIEHTIAVFRTMRKELNLDLSMSPDSERKIRKLYGKD